MAQLPTKEYVDQFLTSPDEKVITMRRKHGIILTPPLLFSSFFLVIGSTVSVAFFWITLKSVSLSILGLFAVISLDLFFLSKALVDWYSHLYIVTTHKILEVCFVPLFSHMVNDVLLEQVRCTEVDVKINGLINQIANVGNVTVTFDRPTHEEEFTFVDIKNPHQFGIILADALDIASHNGGQAWFKQKDKNKLRFSEERTNHEYSTRPYRFA